MELPTYGHTGFTLNAPEREHLRVMRDEVLSKVGTTTCLVDARSPRGIPRGLLAPPHLPQEQSQVPGHTPGATNIPWAKSALPDGSFRPLNELRELYEGRGIRLDREVIAYCRVGERSSHTWFALTELLGYPDVRNYDGSWTEYGSLAGVPVELG
jgi:thiosulfate/3-mercaptopyruvate sulfurtransferase